MAAMEEEFAAVLGANSWELVYRVGGGARREAFVYTALAHAMLRTATRLLHFILDNLQRRLACEIFLMENVLQPNVG